MRETRPFGDALGSYLGRIDPSGKRFSARAVQAWNEVAGPEIRKHTKGLALRDGELVVHVDSSSWAAELTMLSERFRQEINQNLGEELVRSVRFNVSKRVKREAAWEAAERAEEAFYDKDRVEAAPLDDIEKAQIDFCARSIADESVREAAVRAMTKDFEWKKAIRLRNESESGSQGRE